MAEGGGRRGAVGRDTEEVCWRMGCGGVGRGRSFVLRCLCEGGKGRKGAGVVLKAGHLMVKKGRGGGALERGSAVDGDGRRKEGGGKRGLGSYAV